MVGESKAMKIAVTGAAGRAAYALLPLIASGSVLGPKQHVQLQLLDIEPAMKTMEGVTCELLDCAYPLLDKVLYTDDPAIAFKDANLVVFCGSYPLKPGMVRKDLLEQNAKIFRVQGRILGEVAAPGCRVCVVSNPANTIALIVLKAAGGKLEPRQVTALSRLDHNRMKSHLAARVQAHVDDVQKCVIWGNHSSTQVPDVNNTTIKGKPARSVVNDDAFLDDEFTTFVQERGMALFRNCGFTSALSVAKAAADHLRDWLMGTPENTQVSMAVYSDGNPYGVPGGLMFSFPVTCKAGEWQIVPGMNITPRVTDLLQATVKELEEERSMVL